MNSSVFLRETCRLCHAKDLEIVLKLGATPPGDHYLQKSELSATQDAYPNDMVLCKQCGQVQLHHVVDPKILYGRYTYNTTVSLGLIDHFRSLVKFMKTAANPSQGSLIVDIGSNDGSVLKLFKEEGLRVLGIDPATDVAKKATANGIETWAAFFSPDVAEKIKAAHGPASIVSANNVMANLDDLDSMVEGINRLLADDGLFVFETGYVRDLVHYSIIDNIYHEHVSYFAVRPLETFFVRNGLELIDVECIDVKGGSIRGLVQKKSGKRKQSERVKALIREELETGLNRPEIYKGLKDRLEKSKKDLRQFIAEEKAKGHHIAGFGASVGVTTMLHYYGIDASQIDYLADENPVKHNTFSPGLRIPVFPATALYEKPTHSVILFAWRYADPIMKKHMDFIAHGGQFILPLPTLTVKKSS